MCVCVYIFALVSGMKIASFRAVLYSNLWPVRLNRILPHHLIKGKILRKKFIEHKMFSTLITN